MVRMDGDERVVHERCHHVRNKQGKVIRSIGIVHDITERSQVERLKRENKAAEIASKTKDNFLATMSHELRTPLSIVVGSGEMLQETQLTEVQQQLLNPMLVSSRRQLALINDILDLSKIESGKFQIDLAPFCLADLVKDVVEMFTVIADNSGLDFEVRQQAYPEFKIWGDDKRISQILVNLLGNALKFTAKGGVVLTCWVEENRLYFSVEDTGIGMAAETLERLFKPFEQADGSISRRYGGTGLGLYISWTLAEMMEGTIQVVSEEGKGARFTLELPYRESELSSISRNVMDTKSRPSEALELVGDVLVVEDTPELQLLERRIIQAFGVTVTVADNGQEAVEKATQQQFDLIFMDMQMPVMDGLEATRVLRGEGNQTPIIALTANVMQRHREMFEEAGANGFLHKPINKSEIEQMLKQYLMPEDDIADGVVDVQPYTCPLLFIDDDLGVINLYQEIFNDNAQVGGISRKIEEILNGFVPATLDKKDEFSLFTATHGQEGVEIARIALEEERPFVVAFVDMRMPLGMNGLETAKALRKLDERIYIVIVTAYSDIGLEEIGRELGYGFLYLNKPFRQHEIKQVARMLADNWKRERQTGSQPMLKKEELEEQLLKIQMEFPSKAADQQHYVPSVERVSETDQSTIPSGADELVDDEMMTIFRESAITYRIKLTTALSNEDWAELRSVAHTIKGSAASFGYPKLSQLSEAVQFAVDEERMSAVPALATELLFDMDKVLH